MAQILVIDDDEQVRKLCRKTLEAEGHSVREAQDGATALRLLREDGSEVIVCDIYMPEMDGIETIRRLAREFTGAKIIAISGGASRGLPDLASVALQLGASLTLRKPFSSAELVDAVSAVLGRQR